MDRAKIAGSKKPLVIIHNTPASETDTHPVESLIRAVFDGLRQEENKKKSIKKVNSTSTNFKVTKKKEEEHVSNTKGTKGKTQNRNKPIVSNPEYLNDLENTIRLWYIPGSPSSRVLWLIHEIGGDVLNHLKVSVVKSNKDLKGHFSENINANQSTPTIRFGSKGVVLWEIGAIFAYILEHYKSHLVPESWNNDNWTKHYLYTYWCTNTLDKFSLSGVKSAWKPLEKRILQDLGTNEYINGNEFTVTDIMLGLSLHQLHKNGFLKDSPNELKEYYKRVSEREGFTSSLNADRQTEVVEEKIEPVGEPLQIEIPVDESVHHEEDESAEPRSPRSDDTNDLLSSIGFYIFNDNLDYSLLTKALYAIEKARVESGSSYSKMSNYDFAKLTFSAFYGPLIIEPEKVEE